MATLPIHCGYCNDLCEILDQEASEAMYLKRWTFCTETCHKLYIIKSQQINKMIDLIRLESLMFPKKRI